MESLWTGFVSDLLTLHIFVDLILAFGCLTTSIFLFKIKRQKRNIHLANERLRHEKAERMRTEAFLHFREKQLEVVTNALPSFVCFIDTEERYQYVNATYQKWFHKSPDMIIGRKIADVIGLRNNEQLQQHVRRALAGETVSFEFDMLFPDASIKRIRSEYVPYRDSEGILRGFLVLGRDVTEDLKREEGYRESSERLRLAIDTVGMGSWIRYFDPSKLEWSERTYEIFGIPKGSPVSFESLLSLVHTDDQARVASMARLFREPDGPNEIEYRIIRPDGSLRWVLSRAARIVNPEGKVERLLGVIVDITKRKEVEDAMRLSEAHFRQLADTVPALVWTATPDGRVTYFNQRWFDYTGAAKVEGWQDVIYLPDRPHALHQWNEAIRTKTPINTEFRLVSNEGIPRWHLCRAIPVRDEAGHILQWYGTCTDINSHKNIEAELSQAKEVAEESNRLKSAFLANMSHEIRTPLGAVLGFSELLVNEEQSQEERLKCLDAIKRNGDLLSTLISDILDLSKIEAGKLEIERIEVQTSEVIADLKSILTLQAQEKGLVFEIVHSGNIPPTLTTDPLRLRQILVNVVGNAVKFTSKGSVTVTIETRANGSQRDLLFTIADTGPGISVQQVTRLFEPFMQADASSTRKYGGTGLGLTLSRRLARALGGNVVLQSSVPGQGSTFCVTIDTGLKAPLDRPSEPTVNTRLEKKAKDIRLDGINILLVEDAPDNRMLVSRVLQLAGASVAMATNGREGVFAAESKHYDIVLMDLQMPEMDGYEATLTLRESGYRRPIIALTAHAMKDERNRCLNNGFTDYLTKPIDRSMLLGTLRYHAHPHATVPTLGQKYPI